jgi:hypothetical protein
VTTFRPWAADEPSLAAGVTKPKSAGPQVKSVNFGNAGLYILKISDCLFFDTECSLQFFKHKTSNPQPETSQWMGVITAWQDLEPCHGDSFSTPGAAKHPGNRRRNS